MLKIPTTSDEVLDIGEDRYEKNAFIYLKYFGTTRRIGQEKLLFMDKKNSVLFLSRLNFGNNLLLVPNECVVFRFTKPATFLSVGTIYAYPQYENMFSEQQLLRYALVHKDVENSDIQNKITKYFACTKTEFAPAWLNTLNLAKPRDLSQYLNDPLVNP